jgi:hypothetical protein
MKTNPANPTEKAFERHLSLSRRRFLRGVGACLALPAGAAGAKGAKLGVSATGAPLRTAYIYFPNGAIPNDWWPRSGEGAPLELNRTMEPLAKLKEHFQVIGGLNHEGGYPGPDGAGDHARASGGFLTGVRVKKTAGADIHANISIDQVAAQRLGHLTRFPSLELTCDAVRKSGSCDSGYSCAYQYNLAWSSPSTPLAPEPNPRLVFERLFGSGKHGERAESLALRRVQQRSILDFVMDDARRLQRDLTHRDKEKLDQYLTSVREIETRIERAEKFGDAPDPDVETPAGIPTSFQEHIRVMFDMMLLAFQTDATRIATFLLANDGSNRTFPEINLAEGHHYLTHHQGKGDMIQKVSQIDRWYVQQFAWFLDKLAQTKDVDGQSLLHNSMILYGGGIADGNRHTHSNLPVILAGRAGGTLSPGRLVKAGGVPITNLYLSLTDRLGLGDVERFGDSTGRVPGI